ncbi:MAG: 7-cyano-7-deazaguanine synthase QueC [Armatimonadota bacterium]
MISRVDTLQSVKKPAVVLLSGGMDSAVCMALAKRDGFPVHALSIDYGQRHRVELDAARAVARWAEVESHLVVPLDLRPFGGSSLTDLSMPVPKEGLSDGVPTTYVPARNTILLSLALALAEVRQAQDIFIGVNAVDYSGYPDCRPKYIAAFQELANVALRATAEQGTPTTIHAPLINLSKAEIVRLGASLGVPFKQTVSCYDPCSRGRSRSLGGAAEGEEGVIACGRCDSCRIRARAFSEAGVPDPTLYAAQP